MTRVARITAKIAWPQLVVDCTVVAYSIAPLKKADPPVGFFICAPSMGALLWVQVPP
ncbi:hypothetical protein R69919_01071 [Paraburkholderia gardini]|nr:hypothetical protein R69919_01071 [Paraburkholderia gardini]